MHLKKDTSPPKSPEDKRVERYLKINSKKKLNRKDNDVITKSLDLLKAYGELNRF